MKGLRAAETRAAELRAWLDRQLADQRALADVRKARAAPEGGRWLVQHRTWNKRGAQDWTPYVRPKRHTHAAVQQPTKRGARRHFRLTKRQADDFDLAIREQKRRAHRHRMRMARAQKFEPSASIKLKLRAISDLYPPPDFEGVR